MPRQWPRIWYAATGMALLLPGPSHAHSFGRTYNLPIPLWLYIYGASAALVLSFVVFALWRPGPRTQTPRFQYLLPAPPAWSSRAWQALGVLALAMAIATGLVGTPNPYRNWSMTAFWIVFVLGLFYASALLGNLYRPLNPWATLLGWVRRVGVGKPRLAWPRWLGYFPAVTLYMGFIVLELFGAGTPRSLAFALLGYTLLTLVGAALFGTRRWLQRAEFFSLLFRQVARMALGFWRRDNNGRPRLVLRSPTAGLMRPAADMGLVVFILFMLSSTAFDGLKDTVTWNGLYWETLVPTLLPEMADNMVQSYSLLARLQLALNLLVLLASPLLYLGVCMVFLAMGRLVDGNTMPLATAMRQLAPTLIPIVVAYHASHYFTLLLTQAPQIWTLSLDPMGWGTAVRRAGPPWTPSPGVVWHTQVALILIGHVISVAACHFQARELAVSPLRRIAGQLPLLLLMVGMTSFGLWVLAQPVNPSRIGL
ncbi:MAG: hypothetical protein V4562_03205 [Pseudomonadota bacterium]